MTDDVEMVVMLHRLHWTKGDDDDDDSDDHVSYDVLHCCHAMYLHCCLIDVAVNDSADDFVDWLTNGPAAIDHCSIIVLDVLELWHEDMQSNCFCRWKIEREKVKKKNVQLNSS